MCPFQRVNGINGKEFTKENRKNENNKATAQRKAGLLFRKKEGKTKKTEEKRFLKESRHKKGINLKWNMVNEDEKNR